jgi:hypothetical protein
MTLNYVLPVICGGVIAVNIAGGGAAGRRKYVTVAAAAIVFVIALVATIMGKSYYNIRALIEGR